MILARKNEKLWCPGDTPGGITCAKERVVIKAILARPGLRDKYIDNIPLPVLYGTIRDELGIAMDEEHFAALLTDMADEREIDLKVANDPKILKSRRGTFMYGTGLAYYAVPRH